MSQLSPLFLEETIIMNRAGFAMSALALYEYVVTFSQEVTTVWQRRKTATSILLVATRWTMVLNAVVILIESPKEVYVFYTGSNTNLDENNHALLSCVPTEAMQSILEFAAFLEFGLFSALRVFVIMGRSYTFAIVVLVLSLIPIGTSMYELGVLLDTNYIGRPLFTCIVTAKPGTTRNSILTLAYITRLSGVVVDVLVLACTITKTYRTWFEGRRAGVRLPITSYILLHGTLYFVILFIANLLGVLQISVPAVPFVAAMIELLPSILISRFILNLRSLDREDTSRGPGLSFIGDIGEDLSDGHPGEPTLEEKIELRSLTALSLDNEPLAVGAV